MGREGRALSMSKSRWELDWRFNQFYVGKSNED
jgi:hypothetical protein